MDENEAGHAKMSRSEAGKLGGKKTLEKYGNDFFKEIGRKGGEKGGKKTYERYGKNFYEKIGKKGGKQSRK